MGAGLIDCAKTELEAVTASWRTLSQDWGLSWRELRALFPFGGQDLANPPGDTEARMRILIEIGHRLRMDDAEELYEWLRNPSSALGLYSPLDVMGGRMGDLRRLRYFVEQGFGS